jgi:hypothetical protein
MGESWEVWLKRGEGKGVRRTRRGCAVFNPSKSSPGWLVGVAIYTNTEKTKRIHRN